MEEFNPEISRLAEKICLKSDFNLEDCINLYQIVINEIAQDILKQINIRKELEAFKVDISNDNYKFNIIG